MKQYDTELFISKSKELYPSRFNYTKTNYIKATNKVVITCNLHGDFEQTPHGHLRKGGNGGCKPCAQTLINKKITNSRDQFIKSAKSVHGDKFDYSLVKYINQETSIEVLCPTHGVFKVTPKKHNRQGSRGGCPRCPQTGGVGWRRSSFIDRAAGRCVTLYMIRCYNDTEQFYKVGITLRQLSERFETKKSMPYEYEILYLVGGEAETIWDLEKFYHRKFKSNKYTPIIKFGGSVRECYSKIEIPKTIIAESGFYRK